MSRASSPALEQPITKVAEWTIQARLGLRQVGTLRLLATLVFVVTGLVMATLSWRLPLFGAAERALYDLRVVATAQLVDQDPRIVLVVFNDDTLKSTKRRSPLDRALLAKALTQIDALGPKAIGIDILVDEPQAEDDQLLAALRGMKTPTHLAFASNATNADDEQPWQEAYEREFQSKLAGSHSSAASIRVVKEDNGIVRRWPSHAKPEPPLLAVSMAPPAPAFDGYRGGVRFRMAKFADRPLYAEFPIDLFSQPFTASLFKKALAGRYVIVGADISDIDRVGNPGTALNLDRVPPGLKIHADLLAQLLDGVTQKPIPPWVLGLCTVIAVLGGAVTGVVKLRPLLNHALLAEQLLFVAALPFVLQGVGFDTGQVPQFGWAVGWLIAYTATAAAAAVGSEQRNYAQSVLGKYLPRDVAEQIIRDPAMMALHGERREIYALFSDLQGFTEMTHGLEPEVVASLLNAYLAMLSQAVLEHGGTIDKFVGDAVVAFWGAPIARPDDGERAVRAAISMWRVGEAFRKTPMGDHPPLGRTRVGLHRGLAIVGNFGGEGRISYTALGDVMNTAARLESANKQLETKLLVSREALPPSMEEEFRAMGRVRLRGRSTPVEIYEAVPELPLEARQRLNAAYARFDLGEADALDDLRAMAGESAEDKALSNFVRRLETAGPGGVFQLS